MPSPEPACGYLIDRWTPRRGSVHSAYRGATNIVWDDGSWWFVVPAGSPHGPTTVTGQTGAVAGMSCWVRAGHLRIGQRVLRLPPSTWTPSAWPNAKAGLHQRIEILRAGSNHLARDLAEELAANGHVTGRGIGLTPTGDDVLVGWYAAHHALGRPLAPADTRGTTDISKTFLDLAANGHFHEPLRSAIHATLSGTPDLVERTESLYRVGSTSGRDAAAGAALGLLTLTSLKEAA